jgi:hypothetical protein
LLTRFVLELESRFFNAERDGFDGALLDNISNIVRHTAQNGITPVFVDFAERERYDLDAIANELLNTPPINADIILKNRFNDSGLHWSLLYKTFDNFLDAYYKSQKRVLNKRHGVSASAEIAPQVSSEVKLTDALKRQVLARDNKTCRCCGKKMRRGIKLEIDHIIPVAMGGKNVISNLQTLCTQCNTAKGVNEIDYRSHTSPLSQPKSSVSTHLPKGSDTIENCIARVVNEFYHCAATYQLNPRERSKTWEIVLYQGNNPAWLSECKTELLAYIRSVYPRVEDVIIRS